MSELTTDKALSFIADGLCDCMGTLEEHHTNGCPQDEVAVAWLAQVQHEAAVKALREVADAAQVVHEAGYRCPRVITTLEELEALQDQAVILSTDLEVLICVGKTGSNLWADAWGTWIESVLVTLPARVFWDPTP